MSKKGEDILPLNLITTYPVSWSRFKVLRDFLQNFFDAVPSEEFHQRVCFEVDKRVVEIRVEDVDFSYQWLVPIGASTKTTDTSGRYAGHFGEGFKIAALCAFRDFGWRISAGSRDWSLSVTTTPVRIDGVKMQSLAYQMTSGLSGCQDTWLRLERLNKADTNLLTTAVLWSFLYPENPLLGEAIYADHSVAVWRRSSFAIPRGYPNSRSGGGSKAGILFVSRQARGTHELPFAFAIHQAHDHDRDRDTYYDFQVLESIARAVRHLSPAASMSVLEATSRRWGEVKKRRFEVGSWEPIVHRLAANVAQEPVLAQEWRERYPHLLVLSPLPKASIRARNERSQARAWMRTSPEPWRLVQKGFLALGYKTLEQMCEDCDGFLKILPPTPKEDACIKLLWDFVCLHLLDLLPLHPFPTIEVVHGEQAGWGGYAVCRPQRKGPRSSKGRLIRYTLPRIALSKESLENPHPQQALSTLLHELCHAFGSDGSRAFSSALTDVLERIAAIPSALLELHEQWDNITNEWILP